jgi:DNA-binding CsgD family transcriptional regulator
VPAALDLIDGADAPTVRAAHRVALARARVLADAGDPRAPAAVATVLDSCLGTRWLRSYLEEGPAFTDVLRGLDHPSAAPIVASLDRATGRDAATALSDRELAVLQFLPTRLTNQEIGEQLYVSLNTVKTHLKSLYRRLDVRSRDEAVVRARQLGLLAVESDRPTSASALAGLLTRAHGSALERQQREPQIVDALEQPIDVGDDTLQLSGSR